ncbi:MAG TPA: TolC family protein [Candidatus Stercorousia faecigallinarum]|nr:TolC family protein [Candidatus Stercorousia faecigallinarum]
MGIRKIFCHVLLIFIFLLTGSVNTFAIEEVDEDELFNPIEVTDGISLSIKDCVGIAFQNSPKIRKQKYNLDIAKSNLGMAKAQYFPVISAGAGFYNENNSDNIYYNSHYRELPTIGVTLNKLIWDFGKTTAYIKMEEFYKIGAEYEFMDSLCATLFDVKAKYYNLLKSKAYLQVAEDNVKINENFVKLAKKKPDLTTAQLNLSEAKVKLIEARNNYNNSRVDLNNSMYLESQPDYKINNTNTFAYNNDFAYGTDNIKSEQFTPQAFSFPLENAVQIAYDNSPDLNVLVAAKKAMEQSLLYIKRTYFPELTANAGYGFNNSTQTSNNSFQVGVNLNSTVNLMELKHNIKGADAQVNLADNEIILFKKDLYFEVKRAFNNVEKSEKQIPTARLEASQALENLRAVENGYKSNELDYVALQNARKDYIMAVNEYIDSLYNYNMALIQVEMAMHYHIVDIHHRSEHAMQYHFAELIEHLNKVLGCEEKEVQNNKKRKDKQAL